MMTTADCPTNHQLRALALGMLSSDDSDTLFQHIADCDQCRSGLETVEDTGDSLIDSLRDPVSVNFSDEPDCRLALVKALGALANSEEGTRTAEFDSIPKSIGEYEIVRPIGSGGMGNVFLARHTKLGRDVALKILASHRMADKRMLDRFEAEIRAVGRLSHPNIVTAHDAREVDGTVVLVTEYVSGLDLGQLLLRTGTVKVPEACEIARRVAVALAYTNSQGFVHRDIKPSNVMLNADGEIKLLDLGLARLQFGEHERTEITSTGQAMGTADYVAPEQIADSKSVDIRADIYSLGCTLFKLLTGRAPFADDQHRTTFEKMTAHVSKSPPSLGTLLPSAPRGLIQLVDSMLAKKPADRPATPQDVANALVAYCKYHDLGKLITHARLLEPSKQTIASTSTIAKPETQSWLKRTVPASAAVAAGLLGFLLGICFSIIVIITNPDGTKSVLHLAEGSKVEVSEDGTHMNGQSKVAETTLPGSVVGQMSDDQVTPLSLAVLVNRQSTAGSPIATEPELLEAKRLLRDSDSLPVRTNFGTWFAITEGDLNAPIQEMHLGRNCVLVSNEHSIPWPSIRGHVISVQAKDGPATSAGRRVVDFGLRLDKELAVAVRKISKQNIGNQLAIISNGQVRSAPRINAEFGEAITITGIFHPGEAEQLSQWLRGGIVKPLRGQANTMIQPTGAAQPTPKDAKLVELKNNLNEVGLAFHNFELAYGKFPGTSNTREGSRYSDEQKLPPFSWRVAILPYLGQHELFDQYRFQEPWDSKHNLKLLDKMPAVYRSPFAEADTPPGETNLLGFVSKNSALGTDGGEKRSSFTDGFTNTLLVVEAACTVPWTKPQDIPRDAGQARFFEDHPFTYLMVDGSVISGEQPPEAVLNQMISRNGGHEEATGRDAK